MTPRPWSVFLVLIVGCSLVAGVSMVSADKPAIQVSNATMSPDNPTVGETVTVRTTISNLQATNGTAEITDVYLRQSGQTTEYARIEDVGSIAPGGTLTVPLTATFSSAGEKRLTVHVTVRDTSGDYSSYKYPVLVDVSKATVRADFTTKTANGTDTTTLSLTNYGTADISDVNITATVNGVVRAQTYMHDVEAGTTGTATFDTSPFATDTVGFTVTYMAAGKTQTLSKAVDLDTVVSGDIRLTSVEPVFSGQQVTLDGDAANLGGTDARSVLVSVQNTEGVSPAQGTGEYFIGTVEASEFATFELTAIVDNETTSVPVKVSYLVDGERVSTTQQIEIGEAADQATAVASSNPRPSSSSGLPVVPIVVVLVLAILAGGVYYIWNRE